MGAGVLASTPPTARTNTRAAQWSRILADDAGTAKVNPEAAWQDDKDKRKPDFTAEGAERKKRCKKRG
jgi:hypothetical protein